MSESFYENCEIVLIECLQNLHSTFVEKDSLKSKLEILVDQLEESGYSGQAMININNAIHLLERQISKRKLKGRPPHIIPRETLEFMLTLGLKTKSIAELHGVSKKTVSRRMRQYNLLVSQSYTQLDETTLDNYIANILLEHPNTGYKRMRGYLLSQDVKVPFFKILESMRRVDPQGIALRRSQNRAIYRREYFVKYSMEIWHIDTHHKLIRYGFVIRGGIDGKSRTIVYLDAGCDNKSDSNLESFLEGTRTFGVPLRTRSDKGGENVGIAEFMLRTRGLDRGSHICGRSVHNQRIERLWRDVHYGCLTGYKQMFVWLENEGYLQLDDPRSIAVLQFVFLPRIRKHLLEFANAWNNHSMSTEHNQTPLQLMVMNLPPASSDMAILEELVEEFLVSRHEDIDCFEPENIVVVKGFEEFLSESDKLILHTVDVMGPSVQLGADIYIEAMRRLQM